mgnify:CR=1 FL=1
MFISIVTTGQKPAWLLLMRGYIYPFLFFYFARAVVNRDDQLKLVFGYFAVVGIYFAVTGIFEKLHWYELVFPKFIVDPTVAEHGLTRLGFRVRGIFLHPAILGLVMTMGFFPAWHFLSQRRGILPMATRIALLVTTPATLFFTETRSVYLGFLMALLIAAVWGRGIRIVSIGIILAGAVAAFLNWNNLAGEDRDKGGMGTMNTIHYRIELAFETAEIFVDHPFFGVGFMNFDEAALRYRKPRDVPVFGHIDVGVGGQAVSHNVLETIIAEQGALGLLPYLGIFLPVFLRSLRAYRSLPAKGLISKDYVVCVWCGMAAYFINSMFLEMRYFEYVNVLFYFLIGAMVGMQETLEADRARAGTQTRAQPRSASRAWPRREPPREDRDSLRVPARAGPGRGRPGGRRARSRARLRSPRGDRGPRRQLPREPRRSRAGGRGRRARAPLPAAASTREPDARRRGASRYRRALASDSTRRRALARPRAQGARRGRLRASLARERERHPIERGAKRRGLEEPRARGGARRHRERRLAARHRRGRAERRRGGDAPRPARGRAGAHHREPRATTASST